MNVLFNTYPMAFHTPGGGEVQLLAYERYLPAAGVDVRRFDLWQPDFLQSDVVHFFSCIGGSSHFCGFVKQLGLPLVVSSSLWITEETTTDFPIDEIRHQFGLADRVVTNSIIESETLARVLNLPAGKFVDVPNAVDEEFLRPLGGQEFKSTFSINRPFALCVANVEPRKNQLRLVEAMSRHPDLDLVLIGAIRDPAYWDSVLAAGGKRVRHLGTIPHESSLLRSAYAAAEVFVLPSLFETPGLAALEAAAQGARLALTSGGSTAEYFGAAAYYLDPLSVKSIGTAIELARQSQPNPFMPPIWPQAAAKLAAIYAELVANR